MDRLKEGYLSDGGWRMGNGYEVARNPKRNQNRTFWGNLQVWRKSYDSGMGNLDYCVGLGRVGLGQPRHSSRVGVVSVPTP